ncbi:6437_t:CDS:2, partial [Funneliformis mosseae]
RKRGLKAKVIVNTRIEKYSEKNPSLPNIELAQQFCIRKLIVTDILNEKERWLTILEGQGNVKKFCDPKWPQLEEFKKQGETASTPSTESIANNHIALQQLLASYNSENIWNSDETSLF